MAPAGLLQPLLPVVLIGPRPVGKAVMLKHLVAHLLPSPATARTSKLEPIREGA